MANIKFKRTFQVGVKTVNYTLILCNMITDQGIDLRNDVKYYC